MASANLELANLGGRANSETGMLLTAADFNRMGNIALKSTLNVLSLLFFDDENGVPMTGFPRDRLTTDHCKVTATGNLTFEISTGFGLYFSAADVDGDNYEPQSYLPIVVESEIADTLAAHDATHPRIDIVCLKPAWVDDDGASRNVKNPGTGAITSNSVDQRRRFGADYVVVTGTPAASPSAPSVPSGYVEIARATVPATSGAASWEDTRPVLNIGHYFNGGARYFANHVPNGGSDELAVNATSPASMAVTVTRGRATINGITRSYRTQNATITAAHATLHRKDLVTAKQDGTIAVVAGTPGLSPSAPSLPAGSVALAIVYVAGAVTSITADRITDVRDYRRAPVGASQVQRGSLNHDRLAIGEVAVEIGTVSYLGDVATIPLEFFFPDRETIFDSSNRSGEVDEDDLIFVAEFETISSTSTSAGQYGEAGSVNVCVLDPEPTTSDVAFRAQSGVTAIDPTGTATLYRPRMLFTVTHGFEGGAEAASLAAGSTGVVSISLRRQNSGITQNYLVRVYPLGRPGAGDYVVVDFT